VWGSQVDNKTNARVAWDLTILPNVKGGIKKINLQVWAQVLLTKLIT
jgi:hypothetical protein